MVNQRPFVFLIKISLIALVLSVVPMPDIAIDLSPLWMLAFFAYWLVYYQVKGRFFMALLLGVLLDVLTGDILAQNALALILSSAFIVNVKQSFFVSNISTQQTYIFVASCIYLFFILLVHTLVHGFNFSYYLLLAPVTTALIWPIIKHLLSRMKQ